MVESESHAFGLQRESRRSGIDANIVAALRGTDLGAIDTAINHVFAVVKSKSPQDPIIDTYRRVAANMPRKVPDTTQRIAIAAAGDSDPEIAAKGRKAVTFLNMKSVLAAADNYAAFMGQDGEDAVHAGLANLSEQAHTLPEQEPAVRAYQVAEVGITGYIAARDHMPVKWVTAKRTDVTDSISQALIAKPYGLTADELHERAAEIAEQTGESASVIERVLAYRQEIRPRYEEEIEGPNESDFTAIVEKAGTDDMVGAVMALSTDEEKEILSKRYGLDGEPMVLTQIADSMGGTRPQAISEIHNRFQNRVQDPEVQAALQRDIETPLDATQRDTDARAAMERQIPDSRDGILEERQRQVLEALGRGDHPSLRAIAEELGMKAQTVRRYLDDLVVKGHVTPEIQERYPTREQVIAQNRARDAALMGLVFDDQGNRIRTNKEAAALLHEQTSGVQLTEEAVSSAIARGLARQREGKENTDPESSQSQLAIPTGEVRAAAPFTDELITPEDTTSTDHSDFQYDADLSSDEYVIDDYRTRQPFHQEQPELGSGYNELD